MTIPTEVKTQLKIIFGNSQIMLGRLYKRAITLIYRNNLSKSDEALGIDKKVNMRTLETGAANKISELKKELNKLKQEHWNITGEQPNNIVKLEEISQQIHGKFSEIRQLLISADNADKFIRWKAENRWFLLKEHLQSLHRKIINELIIRLPKRWLNNYVKIAIVPIEKSPPQLYLRQINGGRSIRKITCLSDPIEGAGSQAVWIMKAIAFARTYGLQYVHTPFTQIAHADRPMEQWIKDWEVLFNFGDGELTADCNNPDPEVVDYPNNTFFHSRFCGIKLQVASEYHCVKSTDIIMDYVSDFKRKYYLNKSPRPAEILTICVHIRRGDVNATTHSIIFTDTSIILRVIQKLKSVLEMFSLKYRICVFSQGNPSDFVELNSLGVDLFLNTDAIWTMQKLVEADVLITAKSSLSYVAAILSSGIVICEKWHLYEPKETWIVRRTDGDFDERLLERKLRYHIQTRRSFLLATELKG